MLGVRYKFLVNSISEKVSKVDLAKFQHKDWEGNEMKKKDCTGGLAFQ